VYPLPLPGDQQAARGKNRWLKRVHIVTNLGQ
jgi:hypothetical protein